MTRLEEDVLLSLYSTPHSSAADVMRVLCINQSTFRRVLPDMISDGLVSTQRLGANVVLRYYLTPDGTHLANKITKTRLLGGEVVAPRTINLFEGVYAPSATYQRNNGNKHIQSRGF